MSDKEEFENISRGFDKLPPMGGYTRIAGYERFDGQVPGVGPITACYIENGTVFAARSGVRYACINGEWVKQ